MRALLVGLGHIGWQGFADYKDLKSHVETHGETLLAHPRISLIAAVDTNAGKRLEFQRTTGKRVYEDIETALKNEQVDIVTICTPPDTHSHLTKLAYAHNIKCVVCEKPMAMDMQGCRDMLAAAGSRPLIIGHQRRYEQRHRLLRAFLRSGVLGAPTVGASVFYRPPDGDILRNGTHAADVLRFLLGDDTPKMLEPRSVHGFGAKIICERGSITLNSGGDFEPGYLRAMYDDAIECIETGKAPECSGEDGMEAVRLALAAAELENAA